MFISFQICNNFPIKLSFICVSDFFKESTLFHANSVLGLYNRNLYIAITLLLLLPPSRKDFISEVITVTSQFCKRQCFPYTSNFPSPYHSSVFLYVLVPYNKFTLSQLIVDIPSNHSNALSETSTSTWRKPNVLTF